MASVMRNGYLVYMKVKSRGVQSAANTEPTGLSLSFERQNSRWKQCWALSCLMRNQQFLLQELTKFNLSSKSTAIRRITPILILTLFTD